MYACVIHPILLVVHLVYVSFNNFHIQRCLLPQTGKPDCGAVKKLVEDFSPISKVTLLSYTCNVSLYAWLTIWKESIV